MKYTEKTFTLPASGNRTSQEQWDYATLTSGEFVAKYGHRGTCCHCNQPIERGPGGDLYTLVTGSHCPQNLRGTGHVPVGPEVHL